MKWHLSLLALSCFLLPANARKKYNFNQNWKVYVGDPEGAEKSSFDDGGWKEVTTPIANLSTGIAWYRKHFELPRTSRGDKVFLEFEGIRRAGEFYLNDKWIGRNTVTYNDTNWNDKNFYANYGGINKNTLPLHSCLNTTGVYIYAQDVDIPGKSATVTAEAEVRNEYKTPKTFSFRVEIDNLEGDRVGFIEGDSYTLKANESKVIHASTSLRDLEFWSWGYGYLYRVHTSLVSDGFRKTEFENGMFKLNDRALHLKGYAQRSTNEWPALGSAVPPWLNGNLIRWMHVTPWKQDVESLDRLDILQALPAGDSESDSDGRRWDMRVELMRDAIIYNRNNPSVIFYEAGNAGISEEHMKEMKELRDTYDPHGGRAAGSREMLDSEVAEYGGEMLYINKGSRIPFWQMEYSRDEGLRKYWDDYSPPYHLDGDGPLYNGADASSYNRNQDSHAIENVERWVNAGGVNIIFSDSNTHHRGAENYRRSGEVDPVRLPKDSWYAHQVIGHIIGHWNYNATTTKDIFVVSTAEKVELTLNDNSLGWGKQSSRLLYTFFNVTWEAGTLKAFGYSNSEEKVLLDEKKTSGAPSSIRLTPRTAPDGIVANGADIALVDVEVVDEDGQRVPIALNEIDFTLSGEATWRGGIAQGPGNYILSQTLPVENGINRVLLRSTTQAGKVSLRAASEGLKSAAITLTTKPISVDSGLSTFIPGKDLQPNLSRGPTPAGESYVVSRRAVEVLNVTAGSAENTSTASIDDNEETTWRSDSDQDTAWIEYSWDEPVNVSQLVMKLRSFRTERYPIKVSVRDTIVFEGTTLTSLGYVTLDLNATTGESLKIAMNEDDDLGIVEAEIYTPA
ncbi:hypothetical protein BDW67DRAFT_191000 [Aspergillus spinulosporus]